MPQVAVLKFATRSIGLMLKAQLTENVDDARSAAELSRPEPAFVIKRIDELLADEMADEYARVIRDGGARRVS